LFSECVCKIFAGALVLLENQKPAGIENILPAEYQEKPIW
jgi:hypothetical protein